MQQVNWAEVNWWKLERLIGLMEWALYEDSLRAGYKWVPTHRHGRVSLQLPLMLAIAESSYRCQVSPPPAPLTLKRLPGREVRWAATFASVQTDTVWWEEPLPDCSGIADTPARAICLAYALMRGLLVPIKGQEKF